MSQPLTPDDAFTAIRMNFKPRQARKRRRFLLTACLSTLAFCAGAGAFAQTPADYVDPLIGTGGHGHTYPGAVVPFGFVQVSPDTPNKTWDGCSGYHHTDTSLLGFSFNHLSGTGCPDLGNVLLLPTVGAVNLTAGELPATPFSHAQESARAGYYRVQLPEHNVNVELTATPRVGLQRYTFPETADAHVILDLWHGVGSVTTEAMLTIEDAQTVSGYRKETGTSCFRNMGEEQYYFVAEFSRPFATSGVCLDGKMFGGKEAVGRDLKAHFDYRTKAGEQLVVRVGLSSVSVEGARRNLRAEANSWDFDAAAAAARERWNQTLGKVRVETADAGLKKIFYTALYHTTLSPIVFSDADGQFRGPDGRVHRADGFEYYTVLSLWDTFRASQPLLTLLEPRRVNAIVRTMLAHYKILGRQMLPLQAFGGRESFTMIGNHSIPVIAEAYAKGLRDWDRDEALVAMAEASERRDGEHVFFAGYGSYRQQGWIPSKPWDEHSGERPRWSVSKVLEWAYDDACVARFARSLGQEDIAAKYARRAASWTNVFDDSTGFMRGRNADGSWVTPFDPTRINYADYTEANAWQYTFFVPHDVPGLIAALGGNEKFVAKLDGLFDPTKKMPSARADVSGLIGMYAHGNEPCHNYAYLYNFAGQPWKTQARVRQVATTLYTSAPDGLCGNDDCGQMSAWYVFSALGFYPVDPASGLYLIGSPLMDKATLQLDAKFHSGRTFTVEAKNNSAQNIYIQSATLNGQPMNRSWLTHEEITHGGELVMVMGPTASRTWGTDSFAKILAERGLLGSPR